MFARPEAANCKIGVAVTAGEKAQIDLAAFARGLSIAAYIRQCLGLVGQKPTGALAYNWKPEPDSCKDESRRDS